MGRKPFRPRARTMILLGEELIKDDLTAVVEIVKNSYDADAKKIKIEISNTESFIKITDNGHGMTENIITYGWLELATPYKTKRINGKKSRSPILGRILLGEKGVGRFSCHRLAKKLELISRGTANFTSIPRTLSDKEVRLNINWDDFENPEKYLDEVEISFEMHIPKIFPDGSGTVLLMSGLRDGWTDEKVSNLRTVLNRMIFPFGSKPELEIEFIVDGKKLELGFPAYDYVNRADYRFAGKLRKDGMFIGKYNGNKIRHKLDVSFSKESFATCGTVKIEFYVYERKLSSIRANMPLLEKVLDTYAGIAIYRDDFRILPYGEQGVDWLNLDARRISKVSDRLGNRQIQGLISVKSNRNANLIDKTNREGLIENQAYYDLQQNVLGLIKFVENERIRKKKDEKNIIHTKLEPINQQLEKLEKELPQELPLETKGMIKTIKQTYENEKQALTEHVQTISHLSGMGLAAERTTHELGHLVVKMRESLKELRMFLQNDAKSLMRIETLSSLVNALEKEIQLLSPLFKSARASKTDLDLLDVVNKTFLFFEGSFIDNNIKFLVEEKGKLIIKENEGLIIQILINLIDNALYWSVKGKNDIQPFVKIILDGEENSLIITDSGPGVQDEDVNYIFEPLYTRKLNGRGLGLYITEDILKARGYSISLLTSKKCEFLGATFKINFGSKGDKLC